MAQTFDIRFAKSAGLAGIFEAPANEYRWKGAGRLSIDAQGISIAVSRGLLTLRRQSQRIAASDLIDVYREGDALRIEFSTPERPRAVLPFWVSDRKAAAEIVSLLPTQHSLELEDPPAGSTPGYRFDRRLGASLLVAATLLVSGVLWLQRSPSPPEATLAQPDRTPTLPATTAPQPARIPDPAPRISESRGTEAAARSQTAIEISAADTPGSDAAPPGSVLPALADEMNPTAPGGRTSAALHRQRELFQATSQALRADFMSVRDFPTVDSLLALEARWWDVSLRIYNTTDFEDPALSGLRDLQLAVSRSWRYFLATHASGLQNGDPALIERSFAAFELAELLSARVPQYELQVER